jgi:hypothetical protein
LDEYTQACKQDFRKFLYVVWKRLGLPDPTPVQYDIAWFLQHGTAKEGRISRRMIEAFRGVGKSWITSAYVTWRLFKDPDEKVLVVSASKIRSDDFSIFTKKLLNEVPLLHFLRPRDDQRNSNIAFDVGPARPAHSPSVKSVGITGQLTGSRATRIIADDIESANNSATDVQREKLRESIKEFDAIITPDKDGEITFLGTPQTEESLYNTLPERGYQIRIWPARYLPETSFDKYRGALAPMITDGILKGKHKPGDPVEPTRFSDFDLVAREASYGRSGFALQFLLDTALADADRFPLKLADLSVLPLDKEIAPVKLVWASGRDQRLDLPSVGMAGDRFHQPLWRSQEWTRYQGSCLAIDPSGRGRDETGYAVVKQLNGYLYLTAAGGLRDGYSEATLETLAGIARDHKVNWIVIENRPIELFSLNCFNSVELSLRQYRAKT